LRGLSEITFTTRLVSGGPDSGFCIQPGEGPCVYLVRLHLHLGDEAGLAWVGEGYVESVFLEPVMDLDSEVPRGLYHGSNLVSEGRELPGELLDAFGVVGEAALIQ
jgi:hypothetical protein